ncbi:MAG: FkbM family methyltransferase [Nanobdellota archaeon]
MIKIKHKIRHIILKTLTLFPIIKKIILIFIKIFTSKKFYYYFYGNLDKALGIYKVLKPGDIAVQAGCRLDEFNSQALDIARVVGKKGTVIVIEPEPNNIKILKKYSKHFKAKFIIVKKALFDVKKEMIFEVTNAKKVNRLVNIPGSKNWGKNLKFFKNTKKIKVISDNLDNILKEHNINPQNISYVNLTINGAEYNSLKGMTNLLSKNKSMSITVVAGRIRNKKEDIGYINGEKDEIVISKFLKKYGFKTKFRRFAINKFGYVIGTKGKAKVFM